MKNIKTKNGLYFILLLFLVACGKKASHYTIETCIVNHADSKARHINVLFSGQEYSISSLAPDEKKCFMTPLYSEASYSISLCIGDDRYQIKSMGYYWSESNISKVNIFLGNKIAIKNEPNNESSNSEYGYINIGKCQ